MVRLNQPELHSILYVPTQTYDSLGHEDFKITRIISLVSPRRIVRPRLSHPDFILESKT